MRAWKEQMQKRKRGICIVPILIFLLSWTLSKALPEKNEFEIAKFSLNIEIIPKRHWLEGKTRLQLQSKIQGLNFFQFYLRPTLRVYSVKDEEGKDLIFSQIKAKRIFPNSETSRVRINLNQKLSRGEVVEIVVSYGGIFYMPSDFNLKERRYNRAFSSITKEAAWLRPVQLWYPYIPDKSMPLDIRATVPSNWTAIANGELEVIEEESEKKVFVFNDEKTLSLDIFLFAAPYVSKSKTIRDLHLTAYFFPSHRDFLDSYIHETGEILDFYHQKFGKPNTDKFSIMEIGMGYGTGTSAPFGYAMSSHLINSNFPLIPHEIAHLWWGETVSDNLGEDTWLHEGLATFSDYYYRSERAPDEEAKRRILFGLLNRAIPIGNPKTLSILEGGAEHAPEGFLVYERAAFVIQTLKHILGEEVFFRALRRYLDTYRGKKADTAGFIQIVNSVIKKDINWFFEFYLRGKRPPRYRVKFRTFNGMVAVTIYQDYVPKNFSMPLTLEFKTNKRSFRRRIEVKGKKKRFFCNLDHTGNKEWVSRIIIDPDFAVLGVRPVLEDRWEARSLRLEASKRKNFNKVRPNLFAIWEMYPDNVYILHEVAQFYFAQKRWEQGIEIYKKIIDLKPNDYVFVALANIAGAYETMGDKKMERHYLEKVMAKGSSMYSIMRSLMDKLDKLKALTR